MLLSDITDMEGGQLEILKRPKHIATELLTQDTIPESDLLKVSYGEAGKCIAVQGWDSYYKTGKRRSRAIHFNLKTSTICCSFHKQIKIPLKAPN